MRRPAKTSYEFGPFYLDPAEHVLLRDGEPVALRPKELAVRTPRLGLARIDRAALSRSMRSQVRLENQ